jgi:hypothetical protein
VRHPAFEDDEENLAKTFIRNILPWETWSLPFGFPPEEFKCLTHFANDVGVAAVLCGHLHDTGFGPSSYKWKLGRATRTFLMGRTGNIENDEPCIGMLEVPVQGAVRWERRYF